MSARLELSEQFFGMLDTELAGMALIGRAKALTAAMRKGGNVVKQRYREILPRPGYPGDKPGLKALRDTIAVKVKEYRGGGKLVAIIGAEKPAGAHAHLVEHGHEMVTRGGKHVGRVEGKNYLQMAVDQTKNEVEGVILDSVIAAVEEAKQGPPTGGGM